MRDVLREVWEDIKDFIVEAWEKLREFVELMGGWFWAIYGGFECLGCLLWLVPGLVAGLAAFWKLISQGVPQ